MRGKVCLATGKTISLAFYVDVGETNQILVGEKKGIVAVQKSWHCFFEVSIFVVFLDLTTCP